MTLEDRVHRHRLAILQGAALLGNVSQACREAGISRTLFYRRRRRLVRRGAAHQRRHLGPDRELASGGRLRYPDAFDVDHIRGFGPFAAGEAVHHQNGRSVSITAHENRVS